MSDSKLVPNTPSPKNPYADPTTPALPVGSHTGIFSPVIGSNQGGATSAFSKELKTTVAEQPSTDGAKNSAWLKKNLPQGMK